MKRYSQEHQWIEVAADGASALVGITKYAADELGDITFIEMPGKFTVTELLVGGDYFGCSERRSA